MKRVLRVFCLTIILAVATACAFAGSSACSSGGGNAGNSGNGESQIEYGKWNEYDGVRLAYISEEDFYGGNVNEEKVFSELNCKPNEVYFMLVDFNIQAPADNEGTDTVTAAVQVKPATVMTAKLQETNSANFTEKEEGGVSEIKATYKIPEKADTVRNMRLIIKLETLQNSEAYIEVTFANEEGIKAVNTEEVGQTANIGFTKGLTYEEDGGSYIVTGLGEAADGEIILPLYKDGYAVEAISSIIVCERETPVIKHVEDGLRTFLLQGKCLLNADKTEVVFGCGTDELPSGVSSISSGAYAGCSEITEFSMSSSVKVTDGAFAGCENIKSITLAIDLLESSYGSPFKGVFGGTVPTSLKNLTVMGTTIKTAAFSGCDTIENITLSEGITSIGDSAFYSCSALKTINIPKSVRSIGKMAFQWCGNLTGITLPAGVLSIGNAAFYNSGITGVTIPVAMTTIGNGAFWNCKALKSVAIHSDVKNIDANAFNGCASLSSVTIPDSVTEIGSAAFKNCIALTRVTLPKNITEIKSETFSGCSGLTSISIPASVQIIGSAAFDSCVGLTGLTIPEGVTKIMDNAFNGCYKIENITLPKSLMQIGRYAFRNSLWGDITYKGTKAEWKAIYRLGDWNYGISYTLYCTDGTLQKWES